MGREDALKHNPDDIDYLTRTLFPPVFPFLVLLAWLFLIGLTLWLGLSMVPEQAREYIADPRFLGAGLTLAIVAQGN